MTNLPALNLSAPHLVVIHAVQEDSLARWYSAPLLAGDTPWTPPDGASAFILYRRGDGVPGMYDKLEDGTAAVSWSGSTVSFGLADHALAAAGRGELALCFESPAGENTMARLSAFKAVLAVEPTPYPSSEVIDSEPYINILSQQIAAVLEAAADFAGLTVSAKTLAAGAAATATVTGGSGGEPYHIVFGIPRGSKGDKGDKGDKGEPGADGAGAVNSVMGVASVQGDVPAASLFNLIYPVGSLYLSVNSTNPATLFGGTWTRIQDRFLLAAGTIYSASDTGGAASAEIDLEESGTAAKIGFTNGDTTYTALDAAESLMTSASHGVKEYRGWSDMQSTYPGFTSAGMAKLTGTFEVDTLPPYLAVYVWQRTALAE